MKLNLRMFEGAAGADGGDGTGGEAAETTVAAEQVSEGSEAEDGLPETKESTEPETLTPEAREENFKKFRAEYKDLIGRDIEKAVNRRYAENQQLHSQLKSYAPIINLLGARYGVQSGSVEDIVAAIERDDKFYEEAAIEAGMTVDQYRSLLDLQMQNQQLMEQKKNAEEARKREETYNRWNMQAEQCKQMFPGFSMETECQNPDFVRMLGAGVSMDAAYKSLHFDEISQGLVASTEINTQKKVADTIRSGAARPTENGVGKNSATKTKVDVKSMTYEQMDALIDKARNGEQVTLG